MTKLIPRKAWLMLTGILLPALILNSCSSNSAGPSDEVIEPIDLVFEEPPFELLLTEAQFAREVSYGPHEDNVFDIFLVESEEPTPLVIFIHGGGFVTGSKGIVYINARDEIRATLATGASYATINYRLLENEGETEGVLKPLGDSKRCLQFLRLHHEQLNLDPERIALYGASAGAGTSLWLALNDDMADPGSTDPVLRQSTRVSAVAASGTQATYDLLKWETVVFASLGMTLEDMAALPETEDEEPGFLTFYGADSLEQLGEPEYVEYRQQVDMLALMSADDPPIWLKSTVDNPGIPVDQGELLHHGLHALALMEQADDVGIECQAYIPALEVEDPAGEEKLEFLLDRLDFD
jgi:para-nitrobenzyl esterase